MRKKSNDITKAEIKKITSTAKAFAKDLCKRLNDYEKQIEATPANGYISALDLTQLIRWDGVKNTFKIGNDFDLEVIDIIEAQIAFNNWYKNGIEPLNNDLKQW